MKRRHLILGTLLLLALSAAAVFHERLEIAGNLATQRMRKFSIQDRLNEFGLTARARWAPFFHKAGLAYPPSQLTFAVLKAERVVEVYAPASGTMRLVRRIAITAASGGPGPKLREGDRQVPEGLYQIELLNPNSRYHVSLRLDYPNEFDQAQARKEGRTGLGGDIMIHGKSVSIGCIAVGDEAAEDLFTLVADTGLKKVKILSAPSDFRNGSVPPSQANHPAWVKKLYGMISRELAALPRQLQATE